MCEGGEGNPECTLTAISKIYKAFVRVYFVSEGQIIADEVTTEINVLMLLTAAIFPELFTLTRLRISDKNF